MSVDSRLQGYDGGFLIGDSATSWTAAGDNDGFPARGFLVVTEAVLAGYAGNILLGEDLIGATLPAGIYIPGQVTSLSTTSGLVIAVK